ncbi:hypothetical protein OE88DRAFT_1666710 [Heliocybe sulcata]|uniref:Uncharacterized protein n=1 Tax=Heliocybe sulcata TaxID=5364 RepID=A0A5C3MPN5_9AGAM|nr:hypothetical protein OE88DRAFT_1666710 [Heliocybe sulcata]
MLRILMVRIGKRTFSAVWVLLQKLSSTDEIDVVGPVAERRVLGGDTRFGYSFPSWSLPMPDVPELLSAIDEDTGKEKMRLGYG